MRGTSSCDSIKGTQSNDKILGLKGNDTIKGGCGNDTIKGGSGNDLITGDCGADLIIGGSGNDFIKGGKDNDYLKGGSGSDLIFGGSGNDILDGGSDRDILIGACQVNKGVGEVDLIKGSQGDRGADIIVLGDSNGAYYVGRGNKDYALIERLDVSGSYRDTIQLAGSRSDYIIQESSCGANTQIFFDNFGQKDLIAVVDNISANVVLERLEFFGGGSCGLF